LIISECIFEQPEIEAEAIKLKPEQWLCSLKRFFMPYSLRLFSGFSLSIINGRNPDPMDVESPDRL